MLLIWDNKGISQISRDKALPVYHGSYWAYFPTYITGQIFQLIVRGQDGVGEQDVSLAHSLLLPLPPFSILIWLSDRDIHEEVSGILFIYGPTIHPHCQQAIKTRSEREKDLHNDDDSIGFSICVVVNNNALHWWSHQNHDLKMRGILTLRW